MLHPPPGPHPLRQRGGAPALRVHGPGPGGGTALAGSHRPGPSRGGDRPRGGPTAGGADAGDGRAGSPPAGREPLLARGDRHRGRVGRRPGDPRLLHRHQRAAAPRDRGAGSREPPLGGQAGQRGGPRDQQPAHRGRREPSAPLRAARGPSRPRPLLRARGTGRPPDRRHDQPHDAHHPAHAAHGCRYRRRADAGPAPLQRARAAGGEAGAEGRGRRQERAP